jgi:hypothetical protein
MMNLLLLANYVVGFSRVVEGKNRGALLCRWLGA